MSLIYFTTWNLNLHTLTQLLMLFIYFFCITESKTFPKDTQSMPLPATLWVDVCNLLNPAIVMSSEGTISLHTVAEWGCRHWFSSRVHRGLGSAMAEIHWEHIGSDKVLWIHSTISYWVRSNFSDLILCRPTLTARRASDNWEASQLTLAL